MSLSVFCLINVKMDNTQKRNLEKRIWQQLFLIKHSLIYFRKRSKKFAPYLIVE